MIAADPSFSQIVPDALLYTPMLPSKGMAPVYASPALQMLQGISYPPMFHTEQILEYLAYSSLKYKSEMQR